MKRADGRKPGWKQEACQRLFQMFSKDYGGLDGWELWRQEAMVRFGPSEDGADAPHLLMAQM